MFSIKKITQKILLVSFAASATNSLIHPNYCYHESERGTALLGISAVTTTLLAATTALGYACYRKGISNKQSLASLDPSKKDFWGNRELDFKSPPGTG